MKKLYCWLKQNKLMVVVLVLFLALNNLPYILGVGHNDQNGTISYQGMTRMNSADYFVYLSMIQQGSEGQIFTKNLHNPLADQSHLFSPHWYLIGQFSEKTGLGPALSYHIFRILLSLIFLILIWWLLKKIFNEKKTALWGLTMVLFSNGLGLALQYFWPNIQPAPANLFVPELISWLSLSQTLLTTLSQILILLVFLLFIEGAKQNRWSLIIASSLFHVLLILIHPYDLAITLSVLTLWVVSKFWQDKNKKLIKYFLIFCLVAVLAASYYLWALWVDPALREWNRYNLCASGPILGYIFGLGLLAPLSVAGVIYVLKRRLWTNDYLRLFSLWAIWGWWLIYLPVNFNRRLSNGWHVPLAITATVFLLLVLKTMRPCLRKAILIIIFPLLIIDSLLFIKQASELDDYYFPLYFLETKRLAIYQEIKNIVAPQEIILTRGFEGVILPGYTGRMVYLGHGMMSELTKEKNEQLKKIWSPTQDLSVWLASNNISYIFASRLFIPEFQTLKWLEREPYIEVLLTNDDFIFYKVNKNSINTR